MITQRKIRYGDAYRTEYRANGATFETLREARSNVLLAALYFGGILRGDVAAKVLGCSVRSIYRYIDYLRSKGHKIDGVPGTGFEMRIKRK